MTILVCLAVGYAVGALSMAAAVLIGQQLRQHTLVTLQELEEEENTEHRFEAWAEQVRRQVAAYTAVAPRRDQW